MIINISALLCCVLTVDACRIQLDGSTQLGNGQQSNRKRKRRRGVVDVANSASASSNNNDAIVNGESRAEQTWDIYVYNEIGKLCRRNRASIGRLAWEQAEFNRAVMKSFKRRGLLVASLADGDLLHGFQGIPQIFANFIDIHKDDTPTPIINGAAAFTKIDAEFNALETFRASVSVSFDSEDTITTEIHEITERILTYLTDAGFIDPDANCVNGKGLSGCEILLKQHGLSDQIDHTDYPPDNYVSYGDYLNDQDQYDSNADGGNSLFINPTDKPDWIRLPGGELVCLPPFCFMLLAGNTVHHGSDNYRSILGIVKLFYYIDPPGYGRAIDVQSDSPEISDTVYPQLFAQLVMRESESPYLPAHNTLLFPYHCMGCTTQDHMKQAFNYYSYPYCVSCLVCRFNIALQCEVNYRSRSFIDDQGKEKVVKCRECKFSAYNTTMLTLPSDTELDVVVEGNFMTEKDYRRKHSQLQNSMLDAIQICNVYGHANRNEQQYYLDCLEIRSFIVYLRQSRQRRNCNVELSFDQSNTGLVLRVIAPLRYGEEMILWNPIHRSNTLHPYFMCYNVEMVKALKASNRILKRMNDLSLSRCECDLSGDCEEGSSTDGSGQELMEVDEVEVEDVETLRLLERRKQKFSFEDLNCVVLEVAKSFENLGGLFVERFTEDVVERLAVACDAPYRL